MDLLVEVRLYTAVPFSTESTVGRRIRGRKRWDLTWGILGVHVRHTCGVEINMSKVGDRGFLTEDRYDVRVPYVWEPSSLVPLLRTYPGPSSKPNKPVAFLYQIFPPVSEREVPPTPCRTPPGRIPGEHGPRNLGQPSQ